MKKVVEYRKKRSYHNRDILHFQESQYFTYNSASSAVQVEAIATIQFCSNLPDHYTDSLIISSNAGSIII